MHKFYLKYLFILAAVLFFSFSNVCYAYNMNNYLSLNTAPVTLTAEEMKDEKPAENNIPVTVKINTNTEKIKPAIVNTSFKQKVVKLKKTNKIKPLEIVDIDTKSNTLKTNESESFLLVPVDKEQLEKENKTLKSEEIKTLLIKDFPKPLTTKSKIKSKLFVKNSKDSSTSFSKISFLKSVIKVISIIGFILISVYFIYLGYKKREKTLSIKEKEKNLSYEEEKRKELIQAIEEFEETEKQHKKLKHKIYINEVEAYKNLDGFKKDEVADDIIKTMETIENAQKNENPITLKENVTQGFKKNNFAFENDLGILSDEEGIALFDDDDEKIFNTEEEFLNTDYYNENSDFINDKDIIDNDIFIIEDEDENEDENYKIVEENPVENYDKDKETEKPEDIQPETIENSQTQEEKIEKAKPEPKLDIKEKYPLDDNKGLALLKYKNTTALIGYINENITVLKRFSQKENAENLSLRIYEELSDTVKQYLVRVGKYKGIIEVSDSEIKLVLNL